MGKFDAVAFDDVSVDHAVKVKRAAEALDAALGGMLPSRERSVAERKLVEAVMWGHRAVRAEQIFRTQEKAS